LKWNEILDEKITSQSASNENPFEIFVADVEQAAVKADPVYEINGIRIWIQPRSSVVSNSFFSLIAI
jgi:hypothetical protein